MKVLHLDFHDTCARLESRYSEMALYVTEGAGVEGQEAGVCHYPASFVGGVLGNYS